MCLFAGATAFLCIVYLCDPQTERRAFLTELTDWCKAAGVREVVMFASCNAYERWDNSQMTGPQLRYLTSRTPRQNIEDLE